MELRFFNAICDISFLKRLKITYLKEKDDEYEKSCTIGHCT